MIGRPGRWDAIDAQTHDDLQGVCHFAGERFVCSSAEIFRLENGKLKPETRFAQDDAPRTCMNFIVGEACVYAQGEGDLYRFSDGIWSRVLSLRSQG